MSWDNVLSLVLIVLLILCCVSMFAMPGRFRGPMRKDRGGGQ